RVSPREASPVPTVEERPTVISCAPTGNVDAPIAKPAAATCFRKRRRSMSAEPLSARCRTHNLLSTDIAPFLVAPFLRHLRLSDLRPASWMDPSLVTKVDFGGSAPCLNCEPIFWRGTKLAERATTTCR